MITKKCTKCGLEKPIEEFVKNKTKHSGYTQPCIECNRKRCTTDEYRISANKRQIKRYHDNPEKFRELSREYGKKFREKNIEKNKLRHRLYHAKKAGFNNIEDYDIYLIENRVKRKEDARLKKLKEKEERKIQIENEKKLRFKNAIENVKYKVDDNGCWNIISGATKNLNGYYGLLSDTAHRQFYRYYNGEIPKYKIVRHTCDNTDCINPSHLIIGTFQDNTNDMLNRGRDHCEFKKKLSDEEIKEIYLSNKNSYELSKIYNVSDTHIRRIRSGRRNKKITMGLIRQ